MNNRHILAISFIFIIVISSCSFTVNLVKENNNEFQTTTTGNSTIIEDSVITPTLIRSKIPEVNFDPSTINKNIPDNILSEITYFGGGGWAFCTKSDLDSPDKSNSIDMEIMTLNHIVVCGWEKNEEINIEINYPDGKIIKRNSKANNEDGGYYYSNTDLKFDQNSPEGKYNLIFSGKSGNFSAIINVQKPDEIRLYRIDENHLLLYNFLPNESISLYYYKNEYLFGWQTYEVSPLGQLIVKIPTSTEKNFFYYQDQFFVAIGEKSGETHLLFETIGPPMKVVMEDSIIWSCGNFRTRLTIMSNATVAYTDGKDINIRKLPGLNEDIIDTMPEGTQISISGDHPVCSDNITWWKISGNKNRESGWVAEYDLNNYILEPIKY